MGEKIDKNMEIELKEKKFNILNIKHNEIDKENF